MRRCIVVFCCAALLAGATRVCVAADDDPFGNGENQPPLAEKRKDLAKAIQVAPPPTVPSTAPAPGKRKHPTPVSDAQIFARLREPTTFEFVEQPLTEAMETIKEYHQVEIQFDKKGLEEAGVGTDTPVTRNLRGVTLDAALRMLLDDIDLTYVVRDGVLMLTTPEAALRMGDTRVYDIKLLAEGQKPEALATLVEQMLLYRRACTLKQLESPADDLPNVKKDAGPPAPSVRAFGTVLVVNAAWPEQKMVDDFLDELTRRTVRPGQASR